MRKIGFVTPWYGENISGGAEAELRGVAKHLAASGIHLEILTTCVRSFQADWNQNYHPSGKTKEAEINVLRFPVRERDKELFDSINIKLMKGRQITAKEEEMFCREMINSPELYRYLQEHKDEYSLYVFIPYMFGTTYYGCQVAPEKTILIPCLHDESYAYMKCFKKAFSEVKGMIFNSEPELKLTRELYARKEQFDVMLGIGLDTDWEGDAVSFKEKYGLSDPFILYAGRKDAGKKVDLLVQYFEEYKRRHPSDLKLVLIGGGSIDLTGANSVVDLGFVDTQDKYDAYAACSVFCNPSAMESFSLVLMEAWLASKPALVNENCAVTKDFVIKAQAGLYFDNYYEFDGALTYLLKHPETSAAMGENGREFVLNNFAWDVITKRYCDYFERIAEVQ